MTRGLALPLLLLLLSAACAGAGATRAVPSPGPTASAPAPSAVPAAEGEVVVACTPEEPCSRTDGVWMPTGLAARKAGSCARSEDLARRCSESLRDCEGASSFFPSAAALGATCALCGGAGAALRGAF